jgi:hypothetical protein
MLCGQDASPQHAVEHPSGRDEILERGERAGLRLLGRR